MKRWASVFSLWLSVVLAGCVTAPDTLPVLLHREEPMYPLEALQDGVAGSASVEFIIEVDGTVSHPNIVSASRRDFGLSAAACVRKWTFKPGVKNGMLVRTRMEQSFVFETASK
jgi:TonB family protein